MGIVDKFYKDNIEKRDVKRLIQSYKLNDVYEKKTATGEADQDYDKELFDKIVMQLDSAGITGATHREFDKYQGPYLYIPDVDKFWIDDVFTEGEKREEDISKPYKSYQNAFHKLISNKINKNKTTKLIRKTGLNGIPCFILICLYFFLIISISSLLTPSHFAFIIFFPIFTFS